MLLKYLSNESRDYISEHSVLGIPDIETNIPFNNSLNPFVGCSCNYELTGVHHFRAVENDHCILGLSR